MAASDVTITEIAIREDTVYQTVQVSEAVDRGDVIYRGNGGVWAKADADADATGQAAGRDGIGFALTPAEQANEFVIVATSGDLKIDTGLTKGETYIVSDTSGKMALQSDIGSGFWSTVLGTAGEEGGGGTESLDEFVMQPIVSNQQVA